MTDSIEERWRTLLERGDAEWREADASSPLRMLIGVSHAGRPYFALVVSRKPGLPDITSVIEVVRRLRADGLWTLTLELQAQVLADAFISLMSDLAAKSAAAVSETAALKVFLDTLAEWKELLTARAERLTESMLRGLVAELWFGFVSRAHDRPLSEVVWAWSGPLGGVRDFEFLAPSRQFEVKSLRPSHSSIEISSAEQLDGHGVRLAVVTIEEVAVASQGFTLLDLVAAIRTSLSDGSDRGEFNERFARLCVNLDDPWYMEHAYAVRRLNIYEVADDFPAIRRSELLNAIGRVTYQLNVQELPQFTVLEIIYTPEGEMHD